MKQFDKGWWNCFLSYTDELAQIQRDFDVTANAQLKAAGVEKKEIEGILKTEIMSDKTRELLTEYKDKFKVNRMKEMNTSFERSAAATDERYTPKEIVSKR